MPIIIDPQIYTAYYSTGEGMGAIKSFLAQIPRAEIISLPMGLINKGACSQLYHNCHTMATKDFGSLTQKIAMR